MDLAGIRALVIDDHLDSLELARMVLEWDGADVLEAKSAEDALTLLDGNEVDVVVSDLAMPRMDGYQLIRTIRSRRDHKRVIPALAISGNPRMSDENRAIAAGFNRFLAKPVDTDVLVREVRHLVQRDE